MRILHTVEFYEPSKGGAQEVVRQLSERLVNLGHQVTVATTKLPERKKTTINGVKIVEFAISGNEVRGYEGETEKYKQYLVESKFDVIMNYAAQQWATDLFFDVIDQVQAKKILVPCGFSGLYEPAYKEYFKKIPSILRKYDATVYLASHYRDIDFAKKHGIKKTYIIPNGAGEDEFLSSNKYDIRQKLGIPAGDFLITTIGTHTGVKGHKEAIEIYKKANIPNSQLIINGNGTTGGCAKSCKQMALRFNLNPNSWRKKVKVKIIDLPRERLVALLKASDLFLFPSNIEASPIVLFEAAASKTPFLAADVGNTEEIAKWTEGGKILPTNKDEHGYSHVDIKASAKQLTDLYNNKQLREKMAKKGFENWQKKFSWEKIAKQYEGLYKRVLESTK